MPAPAAKTETQQQKQPVATQEQKPEVSQTENRLDDEDLIRETVSSSAAPAVQNDGNLIKTSVSAAVPSVPAPVERVLED